MLSNNTGRREKWQKQDWQKHQWQQQAMAAASNGSSR
jgi:hypothetical protein